jgi:tripartite-type tricarboxylate transporter receptor subunit TctC
MLKDRIWRTVLGAAAGAVIALQAAAAMAEYPDRPITLIVANKVGGGNDTVARLLAPMLEKELGQPVVVENRAGAAGTIGLVAAAHATPDGYTLLASSSQMLATKHMQPNQAVDPVTDLAHLTILAAAPLIAATNAQLGVKDYAGFVEKAKAGNLRLGVSGVGGTIHLASEMYKKETGLKITTIPYPGGSEMMTDLLANQIQLSMNVYQVIAQYVETGKVVPLFVADDKRQKELPDVPTSVELGIPGLENISNWFGLDAPKGIDPVILTKIHDAVATAVASPEMQSRLSALGFQGFTESSEAYAERIKANDQAFAEGAAAAGQAK